MGCLVALLGMLHHAAHAGEFNLVPSITARQEYNSNINLEARSKRAEDDFVSKIIPRLRSTYRTERLTLGFSAEAVPTLYWKNDRRNAVDYSGGGELKYALSPRWSTSARTRFTVDNQPDRNIGTTGERAGDNRRYLTGTEVGLDYALTEITTASLTLGYDRIDYVESGESDFQGFTVGAALSRDLQQWLPRTVGQIGLGYGHYDYETAAIRSGHGSVGLKHRMTEAWDASGILGARYTRSEYKQTVLRFVPPFFLVPETVDERSAGWGGVAQIDVSYTGAMTRYGLSALHDMKS